MLRYFKFHEHVFAPEPAKETYVERAPGKGWPEQCPPIRQANAFGWDILSAFDLAFVKDEDGGWGLEADHALECDFAPESGDDDEEPAPYLTQHAAWFWDPEQRLPHPISPHVFEAIRHQVKVSSFLFLETDPGEVLLVTEVPNRPRPYRAVTALIETDWYPASYPWHGVLELSPAEDRIEIPRGEPLFRLIRSAATPTSRGLSRSPGSPTSSCAPRRGSRATAAAPATARWPPTRTGRSTSATRTGGSRRPRAFCARSRTSRASRPW